MHLIVNKVAPIIHSHGGMGIIFLNRHVQRSEVQQEIQQLKDVIPPQPVCEWGQTLKAPKEGVLSSLSSNVTIGGP